MLFRARLTPKLVEKIPGDIEAVAGSDAQARLELQLEAGLQAPIDQNCLGVAGPTSRRLAHHMTPAQQRRQNRRLARKLSRAQKRRAIRRKNRTDACRKARNGAGTVTPWSPDVGQTWVMTVRRQVAATNVTNLLRNWILMYYFLSLTGNVFGGGCFRAATLPDITFIKVNS